ncbi:hypothetical protein SOCE26_045370 [Sorangium cellulosum]|uniref:Uncharacterized protein n=1 Tax=Sorangium cellulosum TaxID=56 RepID=A0A2L0EUW7_SORCE|nr:hypothetical protein [Sorangium cellulosum]AUX43096.1 hypothetical protein SOCE26_045370 [Sorangium cellulosum]
MSSTSPEEHPQAPDEQRTEPVERPPWTRRFAPLLLIAGVLLGGRILFSEVPEEREVELRLDEAATVVQLDVTWTDRSSGDGDAAATPVHGSTWRFAEGTAPRSVVSKVRLPDGRYDLEIAVDRSGGRDTTHRAVTLGDADKITLPVR